MAKMVGLSRARFYQLIGTALPCGPPLTLSDRFPTHVRRVLADE